MDACNRFLSEFVSQIVALSPLGFSATIKIWLASARSSQFYLLSIPKHHQCSKCLSVFLVITKQEDILAGHQAGAYRHINRI